MRMGGGLIQGQSVQQLFLDGNREGHQTQEKDDEKLKNECLLTKMPVVSRFSSL